MYVRERLVMVTRWRGAAFFNCSVPLIFLAVLSFHGSLCRAVSEFVRGTSSVNGHSYTYVTD